MRHGISRWRKMFSFAVTASLLGRGARAQEPPSPWFCETRTARAAEDIVVPTSVFVDGGAGVVVREGETLCLAGRINLDGTIDPLWLADAEGGKPALFSVRLDPSGPAKGLHVRVMPGHKLAFYYAFPVERAGEKTPDETAASPLADDDHARLPGQRFRRGRVHLVPPEGLAQVLGDSPKELLFVPVGFYGYEPRRPEPPFALADRRLEADVALYTGVRLFRSLRGLDDALEASGYRAFPQSAPSLGAHLGMTFGRWRFRLDGSDAWMSAASRVGQGAVHAGLLEMRVDAGYDFLRWRGLTGFVLPGIGGAGFNMQALAPHWNYLGDRAAALGNPSSSQRDVWLLTLQAGFEQCFPLGRGPGDAALFVSIQGGYDHQVAVGPWFAQPPHADVSDSAYVDFGGAWVALRTGFAAFGVN